VYLASEHNGGFIHYYLEASSLTEPQKQRVKNSYNDIFSQYRAKTYV
jgi:hypothetical protein